MHLFINMMTYMRPSFTWTNEIDALNPSTTSGATDLPFPDLAA